MPDGTKVCTKCGVEKPAEEFPVRGASKATGEVIRRGRCDVCNRAYHKAYYEAEKDRWRGYARASIERDPEHVRRSNLRKYGVSPEEYARLLAGQGGVCLICGGRGGMSHMNVPLVVDHDHETGSVRGLLCAPCNAGLGQLGDNIERLMSAAAYLLSNMDVVSDPTQAAASIDTGGE